MSKYLPPYHVDRVTHEQFIHTVIEIGLARLSDDDRARCAARVTYGAGQPDLRGV